MKRWPLSHYLIATLCLAVPAWLLDSMFFSSPSDAVALQSVETSSVNRPVVGPALTAAPAVKNNVVGAKLHRLRDSLQLDPAAVKNAFIPSAAWRNPNATTSANPTHLNAEAFASHYRLLAVMMGDNGKYANVNGKVVSVGQKVGRYRLVKLGNRSAVFEVDGNRVVLHLEKSDKDD